MQHTPFGRAPCQLRRIADTHTVHFVTLARHCYRYGIWRKHPRPPARSNHAAQEDATTTWVHRQAAPQRQMLQMRPNTSWNTPDYNLGSSLRYNGVRPFMMYCCFRYSSTVIRSRGCRHHGKHTHARTHHTTQQHANSLLNTATAWTQAAALPHRWRCRAAFPCEPQLWAHAKVVPPASTPTNATCANAFPSSTHTDVCAATACWHRSHGGGARHNR